MKWSIPEKVIERGRQYLREGRVLSVVPDYEHRVWHAEVLGSERYRVDLDGTGKEEDLCGCPYWQEHHYCKHTVAVELYLRQEGISRVINAATKAPEQKAELSLAKMLNQGFTGIAEIKQKRITPLFIELIVEAFETNPYHKELDILAISLRVGNVLTKRSYIVKNIYDFLKIYLEEGEYTANRQYVFSLVHEAFEEEQKAILDDLAAAAATSQLIGKVGVQAKGKLDKRYLLLPVQKSIDLIKKFSDSGMLTLKLAGEEYHQIFFDQQKPLSFRLSEEENKILLTIQDPMTAYFSYYHWGFSGNQLTVFTPQQQTIYQTLVQLLKRTDTPVIPYQQEQLPELFTQVFPQLRQIGEVEISQDIQGKIQESPLKGVVIFRKIKGTIKAEVEFHYDDVIFSTNEEKGQLPAQGIEVLRDTKKEQRILKLFSEYDYQAITTGFEKTLPKGEKLYQFFQTELPAFRRVAEIRIGKKLRELFLDAAQHQPQLTVDQQGSWLDIRFDITGINEKEIDAVLNSLLRNDRFYTLESGEILSFDSEEFQAASELIQQLRDKIKTEKGHLKLPKSQAMQLQQTLLESKQAVFSDSFHQMVYDLTHPEEYQMTFPKVDATLRPYQITGVKWLKMLKDYGFGGILADEMGLGKTLQMITFLLAEKEEAHQLRVLIVTPASLTYNWQAEVKKFASSLSTAVISGNRQEREHLLREADEIVITSYSSLRQDLDLHQLKQYDYLILDEAQMVKNAATKTAKALRELAIPYRFALSGTPIENNLEELWSLFQIVMPGFFPNQTKFKGLPVEQVAQMIKPFVLRRDKKTVLQDLPEKIETNLLSTLTEEQKLVYVAYLRRMKEEIDSMDSATFKKNRVSILAGLTRLRQICDDPRLFMEDYQGGSGKLNQVLDLIQAAKENKRRILLFSQFTSMLSLIETELDKLDISTFYLRGSTKAKDRITMVDAFNAGEKDVFLISLKAGGTGLNLTGADTVILYDLWWNPAVEEQAAGRAHRIGQKKVVEVWRMIAEGTIEERMSMLQQEKRELFERVIQGNEQQLQSLTEEDIRMILSFGE